MEKVLNGELANNFNKRNAENIKKLIEEPMIDRYGMFVDESGNGKTIKPSEESRKICAKSLLR